MIYPENDRSVDETYEWDDRIQFQVLTVNLGASWEDIHERLMKVLYTGKDMLFDIG
ncbi:hypothetical protein ACI2OX_03570 [Bacillus sp. N9]